MRIHNYKLKTGITRSKEFEKKGLASFAVNCGLKCGHDCLYCSTGAMLRCHKAFKELGEDPFGFGYAIIDPSTPERVAKDAKRIKNPGLIQLSTTVDAYSPEAQELNLGQRCMKAILSEPDWSVRILTKNSAVRENFDLIEQYRDRILLGLSITATPDNADVIKIIESNAPSIPERMAVMSEANELGLRTYGMLCPLLPSIADSPEQIDELIKNAVSYNVEEIFVEAVNPRGGGLINCQKALELGGYEKEAKAICLIRKKQYWSQYVVNLIANVQQSVRRHFDISKLRFLLYPSRLLPEHVAQIRKDDAGVIWL